LIKQVPAVSDCPRQDSLTVHVPKVAAEGDVWQRLLFQIKKGCSYWEVIIKGDDLSYIVTLLTVL